MNDDSDWGRQGSNALDLRPLSAFADNELSATERSATLVRMTIDRGAADRVAGYRAQKAALTVLFGNPRDGARCIVVRHRTPWWRQAGVAAACMVMGVALGSSPGWVSANFAADPSVFAERADIAFAVYAPEQRHPVEVAAPQRDQLVDWLSLRLGQRLSVPSLRDYGYSLVGGRLLPGESGPAAQFMYQNAAGIRLTMYVAAVPKGATAFRLFRNGNRSTFYWGSQGTGCALTGQISTVQLRSMAIDACSMLGRAFRSREASDGLNP